MCLALRACAMGVHFIKGRTNYGHYFYSHQLLRLDRACAAVARQIQFTFPQAFEHISHFSGMETNLPTNYHKVHKNPALNLHDPRASALDQFLTEFTHLSPQGKLLTQKMEVDGLLRDKVDAITDHVRHSTQYSTGTPPEHADGQHLDQAHLQPATPDLPVRIRLDTMEIMLREIRDSMHGSANSGSQPGQAQPQAQPLGNPLPATDPRVHAVTAGYWGRLGQPKVATGQAQPRWEPNGYPPLADDRVPQLDLTRQYRTEGPRTQDRRISTTSQPVHTATRRDARRQVHSDVDYQYQAHRRTRQAPPPAPRAPNHRTRQGAVRRQHPPTRRHAGGPQLD